MNVKILQGTNAKIKENGNCATEGEREYERFRYNIIKK